ncbi:MAG: hypothetical protein IPM57_07155 [Oligoflexia bacterium]|nr:hypothetical protein [Oligoflexia bacterium]
MTKHKAYKYGTHTLRAYCKPVGEGYEVGLTCRGRTYFVGNFIHKEEAFKWWAQFNKEITLFAKKHWVSEDVSFTWYCKFLGAYLYKCYYKFLDKLFAKYNKTFHKAYSKDARKYRKMKKHFDYEDKNEFIFKAA